MRKLCLSLMALLTATIVFSAELQVTSPNGGENWLLGSVQPITWRPGDFQGPVRLFLLKDGERLGVIVNSISVSRGSYDWTVGSYESGGTLVQAAPGSGYKVRVKAIGFEEEDASDQPFSLYTLQAKKPATTVQGRPMVQSIKVLSPNGGESHFTGRQMTVRYQTEGSIDRITINLIRKTPTVFFKNIGSDWPIDGEYSFQIPSLVGFGRDPGTWVIEANGHVSGDTWVKDESDRTFALQRGLDLEVTWRDLTIYSRKRGAEGWEVAAAALLPGLGPAVANKAQGVVSFRIHVELNIRNTGAEWPHVPLAAPWRIRIVNNVTHAEFASQTGTVDLVTTGTWAVASADFIMDASISGVFDVEIDADPDNTCGEVDFFRGDNKKTKTFSIS